MEHKDKITQRLLHIWNQYPELRLGQLIFNVFTSSERDLYYHSDEELIRALEEYYKGFDGR